MGFVFRLNLALHVLSAVYWVGVGLFDALVLGPAMRSLAGRPWLNELQERLRPRLTFSTWVSLGVLIATGIGNVVLLRLPVGTGEFWRAGYGGTLLLKLAVVAVILVLVAIHNFVQVPTLRRLRLRAAEVDEQQRAALMDTYRRGRRSAAILARFTVALAVVAVVLGVWMTTGG